jgi:TonB family protein
MLLVLSGVPPAAFPATDNGQPVPVNRAKVIRRVEPVYPQRAVELRIQGVVRFSAVFDTDGRVVGLRLVSGHPLLVPAARAAALQWVFEPIEAQGRPVRGVTRLDVEFHLDPDGTPRRQEPEPAAKEHRT